MIQDSESCAFRLKNLSHLNVAHLALRVCSSDTLLLETLKVDCKFGKHDYTSIFMPSIVIRTNV